MAQGKRTTRPPVCTLKDCPYRYSPVLVHALYSPYFHPQEYERLP